MSWCRQLPAGNTEFAQQLGSFAQRQAHHRRIAALQLADKPSSYLLKQLVTRESLCEGSTEGPNSVGQSTNSDNSSGDQGRGTTGYRRLQRGNCASLACYHCYTNNITITNNTTNNITIQINSNTYTLINTTHNNSNISITPNNYSNTLTFSNNITITNNIILHNNTYTLINTTHNNSNIPITPSHDTNPHKHHNNHNTHNNPTPHHPNNHNPHHHNNNPNH